jgi:ethanolamine transporter EutH
MTNLLHAQIVVDPMLWQVLLYILAAIVGVALVYLIRIHIAVKMAEKRNRSKLGWGLFSFFISPLWAWIILAILGKYTPPDE